MELFLLIAIGITVISLISIVLTKPNPTTIQEIIPEANQAELVTDENAQPRQPLIDQEDEENLEEEGEEEPAEQELAATMA